MGQRQAPSDWVNVPQVNDWVSSDSPAAKALTEPPSPAAAALGGVIQGPIDALKAVSQLYKVPMTMTKNINALNQQRGMPSTGIRMNAASDEENAQAAGTSGALLNLLGSAGMISKAPQAMAAIKAAVTSNAGKKLANEAVKRILQGAGAETAYQLWKKIHD